MTATNSTTCLRAGGALRAPSRSAGFDDPAGTAEFLLERAINRYHGSNEQIRARVGYWHGKIELNERLNSLFMIALNSDDLALRASAIELDLAALSVEKRVETIDRLEADARQGAQAPRANALWRIGL